MISLMGGSVKKMLPDVDNFQMFLIVFVIFFVKVYLVQYSYNFVAPKLIKDFGDNDSIRQFESMSFTQAIFLVILFNNLFR